MHPCKSGKQRHLSQPQYWESVPASHGVFRSSCGVPLCSQMSKIAKSIVFSACHYAPELTVFDGFCLAIREVRSWYKQIAHLADNFAQSLLRAVAMSTNSSGAEYITDHSHSSVQRARRLVSQHVRPMLNQLNMYKRAVRLRRSSVYDNVASVISKGMPTSVTLNDTYAKYFSGDLGASPRKNAETLFRDESVERNVKAAYATIQVISTAKQVSGMDPTQGVVSAFSGSWGGQSTVQFLCIGTVLLTSQEGPGHEYHAAHQIRFVAPGQAHKIAKDPESAKDLLASFPTGGVIISKQTADEIQDLRVTEDRCIYYLQSGSRIKKEDASVRNTGKLLEPCAVLLGMTDLVYLNSHAVYEDPSTGLVYQSFVLGTSSVHGLCGSLRWCFVWDPSRPDCIILILLILAHTMPHRRSFRHDPQGFSDFDSFFKAKEPRLSYQRDFTSLLMPQKLGELGNELLRASGQFDAKEILDKVIAAQKVREIELKARGLVPVQDGLTSLESTFGPPEGSQTSVGKGSSSTNAITGSATEQMEPGLYIGDNRVLADVSSIFGAQPVRCWKPVEREPAGKIMSTAVSAVFDAKTIASIQSALHDSANSVASSTSPIQMITPNPVTKMNNSAIASSSELVIEGLMTRGLFDPALNVLLDKQREVETRAMKAMEDGALGTYPKDLLADDIRGVVGSAISNAGFPASSGVFGTSLNTAVLIAQLAVGKDLQLAADLKTAQAVMDQAKLAIEAAKGVRDQTSAAVQASAAQQDLASETQLAETIRNPQMSKGQSTTAEEQAKAGFADHVAEDIEKTLIEPPINNSKK
nr:hypothetical protein CFP56_22566 [Quercus suber]